jgi:hypothetical protein
LGAEWRFSLELLATLEVTAANLAIETFLPMDPESAARLAELSAPRSA